MTTKPHHDYASIAADATRLRAVAIADLHEKAFAKHIDKHDLDAFAANAAKLTGGDASRTTRLDEQVGAGVHLAQACAALASMCRAIRDEAELEFFADPKTRNEIVARAFGYGRTLVASQTSSVESFAHALLGAAKDHPKEAAKVHLDAKGVHHVNDAIAAVEGADIAHVGAAANRHDATTSLDSLAHVVSAEAAHIRFVAKRVFRGDEAKLARYESTLPRHEVKHRTRLAPPAATTSATGAST